jgi:hypothetical protein
MSLIYDWLLHLTVCFLFGRLGPVVFCSAGWGLVSAAPTSTTLTGVPG